MEDLNAQKGPVQPADAEDPAVPNASTQISIAQVVDGQHVSTPTPTSHSDSTRVIATQDTSTEGSASFLMAAQGVPADNLRGQNFGSGTVVYVARPPTRNTTIDPPQKVPQGYSTSEQSINASGLQGVPPPGDHNIRAVTQSANTLSLMPLGPGVNPIADHTVNSLSYLMNSEANQRNAGEGLHPSLSAANTHSPGVSVSMPFYPPNSGNSSANSGNEQALPIPNPNPGNVVAGTSSSSHNRPGTSAAPRAEDPVAVALLEHIYSGRGGPFDALPHMRRRNQAQANAQDDARAHAAAQDNITVQANAAAQAGAAAYLNYIAPRTVLQSHNPGQSTHVPNQPLGVQALMNRANQARNARARNPRNHSQGPVFDPRDAVAVELSNNIAINSRTIAEHRGRVQHYASNFQRARSKPQAQRVLQQGQPPITTPATGSQPATPSTGSQPATPTTGSRPTDQDPASASGETQTTNNAFDGMLQIIGEQDTQLAAAGLDRLGFPVEVPPRPTQVYLPNDMLQAYLIRMQLIGGIPPNEVIRMDSHTTQQRLRYGERRASNPAIINVNRRIGRLEIPYIPPARFTGRLEPLPTDTEGWYPAVPEDVQALPSSASLPPPDDSGGNNTGVFASDTELLQHIFPENTQQESDNDVIMSDSNNTTPQSQNSEDSNPTDSADRECMEGLEPGAN
ncbi:hypothetical protein N7520_006906 [Penicillium odoratum]|uniref:uncharacterized protein n=1 Tax=Penicillium odoratum TaxID=1167516 RepID=UPI00254891B8|nr:uncharacterized protein N7520_006906 [Penicillium odoratum]KAJ5759750.1 hypothetical protein N7520_006906 [Penicillium odoratum]